MNYSKAIVVAMLLVAMVLALGACGGEPETAPTAAVQEATATTAPAATDTPLPPTDTPVPPTEEPTAETSAPEVPEGTGLDLDNLKPTSDLTSYRSTMTMSISGTSAGEPVENNVEFFTEYTSEPPVQHIMMSGVSAAEMGETGDIDMYQLEDLTYIKFGEQWLSVPTTEEMTANLGIIEPGDLLEDTCGWQQQDETRYEGIEVYHWTMDTEDARACITPEMMEGIGGIEEATGDLFLAKEDNYIVHMEMVLAGTDMEAGLGTEDQILEDGRMEITFDMRDVNEPFTIEVPEEALASGALPEDIPIPEDAEEVTNAFGMISYKTVQTPAEINDYYQAQMPENGWTEENAAEMSGMFTLEYSKEGRSANFTINTDQDSGKTSVLIMVTEPES